MIECNPCWDWKWRLPATEKTPFLLHIITPVTRVENLPAIAKSIEVARNRFPNLSLAWGVHLDGSLYPHQVEEVFSLDLSAWVINSGLSGTAGHVHRNTFLSWQETRIRLDPAHDTENRDKIRNRLMNEWIMSLDDDNILHPELVPWIAINQGLLSGYSGVIFDQEFKNGVQRLQAHPDKVSVGNIDTAQYMFRAGIVQNLRFDETRYDADGVFIEELYKRHKDKFLIVNQPLCYYNYLRS